MSGFYDERPDRRNRGPEPLGQQQREGFRAIVNGWTLVDDWNDLTDRIERAGHWTKANGPLLPAEEATIRLMIESQIARGEEFLGLEQSR